MLNGMIDGRERWMDDWMARSCEWMNKWHGCMVGIDGWMSGCQEWMDRWMNGRARCTDE